MALWVAERIPTHIVTGFLGAGKTTLLKNLLAQKPVDEVWAVLVNEFGQIGLDQALLDQSADHSDGIAIREVAGGCLCCSSQLPMQIALSRLLSQAKPQRLWIEPTGLGHPLQLVEQLTESHWQQALELRAVVTVVDGTRLHDRRLTEHESFVAQLKMADVVALSHTDQMTALDEQQWQQMAQQFCADAQVYRMQFGALNLADIDRARQPSRRVHRSLLHVATLPKNHLDNVVTQPDLPFHYVEQGLGQQVGGWRLPADWCFDRDRLLTWLMSLQYWQRIKGVMRTPEGWLSINLVPNHLGFNSHSGGVDNRLEIIADLAPPFDWVQAEAQLMGCLHVV